MKNSRLTNKEKNSNDFQWYKEKIDKYAANPKNYILDFLDDDALDSKAFKMKVNYDLFNNKINPREFEKVCYPLGKEAGTYPVDFTNKDIVSGKIKSLMGMEMGRPFSFTVNAVNKEATTRKEQEEFGQIRDYVIQFITEPIRKQLEAQQQQALQEGASPEEQAQMQQQVEEEMKLRTPAEVKLYMQREHQDPAEILAHQLLRYLFEKESINFKFNQGWKHGLISSYEIFYTGIEAKEPILKVVNPLNFNCGATELFVEDAEWASYTEYKSVSEIVRMFSDELEDSDIDKLYDIATEYNEFSGFIEEAYPEKKIAVIHCEWKDLKPIKFLEGIDLETGEPYEMIVDENYKFNKEAGDTNIITKWVPARYEGYKIGNDLYLSMREVPGQYFDLNTPGDCKLSYKGCMYDAMNSEPTSIMDRIKQYQYLYNIILYRIEVLMASDKGKIMFLNSSMIPLGSMKGMTLEKWFNYTFLNKIGLLNPNEEGTRQQDVTQAVKELDLSLVSDIQKYLQLADYIEKRCGESVGVTKQIEGQIGNYEAVRNTQQAIVQAANILEPYFELHSMVKRNVLQALIETAKVAYLTYRPECLSYVVDDIGKEMLKIDYDLLENSTYGIFISNSMRSNEALQMVRQLSHAAMQNQAIELSDVIKIMRSESITEAEEMLKAAEQERREQEQQMQQQQQESQKQLQDSQIAWEKEKIQLEHKNRMEEIDLKGQIELQKQTILSTGFNEDKDLDNDGMPDVLEIYKAGVNADIKMKELDLKQQTLEENKKQHEDKMSLERDLMKDKKELEEKKLAQTKVLKSKVKA